MSSLLTADLPHKQHTQPVGVPEEIFASIKLSISSISVKNVEPEGMKSKSDSDI